MTEEQWLASTDPKAMIRLVLGCNEPRVVDVPSFPDCRCSDRKLRLFACACYRSVQHLLPDAVAESAVGVAEAYADGCGSLAALEQSDANVRRILNSLELGWRASRGPERARMQPTYEALALARQICRPEAPKAAYYASSNAYLTVAAIENPGAAISDSGFGASQGKEQLVQAAMLRDIIGPGLFHAVSLKNEWRTPDVVAVATFIYQYSSFDKIAALGAALSDAGCTAASILEHCSGGRHVKGCFLVDMVLGKE